MLKVRYTLKYIPKRILTQGDLHTVHKGSDEVSGMKENTL